MAERYIPEHRRTQFKAKNTFKPEELRRRREEQQVEIRKAKREENLAKRRGLATGDSRPGASLGAAPDSDDDTAPTESQVSRWQYFLAASCKITSGIFDTTEEMRAMAWSRTQNKSPWGVMWGSLHTASNPSFIAKSRPPDRLCSDSTILEQSHCLNFLWTVNPAPYLHCYHLIKFLSLLECLALIPL